MFGVSKSWFPHGKYYKSRFFVAIVVMIFGIEFYCFLEALRAVFRIVDDFISLENSFENEVIFGVVNNPELLIW